MHFLHLTLLSCLLIFFLADPALELKSIMAKPATTNHVVPEAANIMLQSKDGGVTWQDISQGLPVNELPADFFAGKSDLYLRVKNEMYRSKGGLQTPVWEKETVPGPGEESVNFNRSGVRAFNYSEGQVYQQTPAGTWSSIDAKFKTPWMPMIFETSDGTLFYSSDGGLYRSVDKGQSWKTVMKGRGSPGWWKRTMFWSERLKQGSFVRQIMVKTGNPSSVREAWASLLNISMVALLPFPIASAPIPEGYAFHRIVEKHGGPLTKDFNPCQFHLSNKWANI
jgi:hypothetical protein